MGLTYVHYCIWNKQHGFTASTGNDTLSCNKLKGKEFKKNIDIYVYMYNQITSLYTWN